MPLRPPHFALLALLPACSGGPSTPPDAGPAGPPSPEAVAEARRLDAVQRELARARVTEIVTPADELTEAERAMLVHLLDAARGIEELYWRQRGVYELWPQVADAPSRTLFLRNNGPWCEDAATREDPDCSALAARPPRVSGEYPAALQTEGFCEQLQADHPELFEPFVAVVGDPPTSPGGAAALRAVPYSQRWPEATGRVATALDAAATALDGVETEASLRAYLRAAAAAFRTDDWYGADAAWAAMRGTPSRWYLRVGPDETYFDPCGRHGGFHLSLARISDGGARWKARLTPVVQDMEGALAALAGPHYRARRVGFELPEFIEIVLNAGDDRSPVGATVGQSLPNWGPVADAGGRTVAMTNLGTDPVTLATEGKVLDSLLCPTTRALWPSDPAPQLGSTVLHEAAHNLGPIGSHRVDGKTDEETLGGAAAGLLEELKAQTAALYFPPWLAKRGLLGPDEVVPMAVGDLAWSLSQISNGFYEGDGTPSTYPQLAAIQLGWLHDHGALAWSPTALAPNGTDAGCFELDAQALGPAVDSLAAEVLRIEGDIDGPALAALVARHVDGDPMGAWGIVRERFHREPEPSYVYVVAGERFEGGP